jgi:hypothetical protein
MSQHSQAILDSRCEIFPVPLNTVCTASIAQNVNEIVAQVLAASESFDLWVGIGDACCRASRDGAYSKRRGQAHCAAPNAVIGNVCQDGIGLIEKCVLQCTAMHCRGWPVLSAVVLLTELSRALSPLADMAWVL